MHRLLALCALALALCACDGSSPAPVFTYECTTDLRCTTEEACVRHYSLSSAMPDRFECVAANGCADALMDYCDSGSPGATCNPSMTVTTDADGGVQMVTFAQCSYP